MIDVEASKLLPGDMIRVFINNIEYTETIVSMSKPEFNEVQASQHSIVGTRTYDYIKFLMVSGTQVILYKHSKFKVLSR